MPDEPLFPRAVPEDYVPRTLADAMKDIAVLKKVCENQELLLREQGAVLDGLVRFQTQVAAGWKMLAVLGGFTLGISYLLYNLKNIFGK